MNWRSLSALLLALLLPVPLIWALGWWHLGGPGTPEEFSGDGGLVPRLSFDEQSKLPTFLRNCEGDEDCAAPLVCLQGVPLVKPYCTLSECATDLDCEEGFACRAVKAGPHVVRLCGARGQAREGEWCLKLPLHQASGCEPGLVCASNWCSRPCQPGEHADCPEGTVCGGDDAEGPACLPSCEGQTCPEGQRCVRLPQGPSICAHVNGRDCQREACSAGQVCEVYLHEARRGGEAWMACKRPCGPETSCPEGSVCLSGRCRTRCEPGRADNTCGPEQVCRPSKIAGSGVCLFGR